VLGGLALMGVVPSGAYLAKKLLLDAADGSGQWWWSFVLQAGGFFTTGYVLLVLTHALRRTGEPVVPKKKIKRLQEVAALALAACSLLLALATLGPVPAGLLANPLSLKELGATLLTVAGGAAVALCLGRTLPSLPVARALIAIGNPVRRAVVAIGTGFERTDGVLRRWPVAGLSLLTLALLFGAAMAASR
jgi:multicomponent Na+:H+ antiporter subunit D